MTSAGGGLVEGLAGLRGLEGFGGLEPPEAGRVAEVGRKPVPCGKGGALLMQ